MSIDMCTFNPRKYDGYMFLFLIFIELSEKKINIIFYIFLLIINFCLRRFESEIRIYIII